MNPNALTQKHHWVGEQLISLTLLYDDFVSK